MADPVKIEIELFDLEYEKNFATSASFIEIHETYFRRYFKHDSEVPKDKDDLSIGWQSEFQDWDLRIKRESIVSVEKYWSDINNHWRIEMESNGYPGTIRLHFQGKDTAKMNDVFEILFKWVFKL